MLFSLNKENKENAINLSVFYSIDMVDVVTVDISFLLFIATAEPIDKKTNLHLDFIAIFSPSKKVANYSNVNAPLKEIKHTGNTWRILIVNVFHSIKYMDHMTVSISNR